MRKMKLLYPISFIYRIIIFFRNKFFDWGIFKEKEYPIPIICVGNITVGGTGKTPHVEYLIELLRSKYKIAVLSRGYKRKTHGFILAKPGCDGAIIGDEPFQLFLKYQDILVAVDKKRQNGIDTLLSLGETDRPEIILLDDAFQHRYVKPGLSILLMNYNSMPYEDALLPVGLLREPIGAKKRADIVLITKCDENIKPIDILLIKKRLNLFPYQFVFFTKFKYADLYPVFKEVCQTSYSIEYICQNFQILLVTGIASSEIMRKDLEKKGCSISHHLKYNDHHWYTIQDIKKISEIFNAINFPQKIILTTEKDAVKIQKLECVQELKESIFYLPIQVSFLNEGEIDFNNLIENYVITDKRNSIFS